MSDDPSIQPSPSPSPPPSSSSSSSASASSSSAASASPDVGANDVATAAPSRQRAFSLFDDSDTPVFSPELESTLNSLFVLDELDAASFSPTDYINKQFPDDHSLSGDKLSSFLAALHKKQQNLQDTVTRDIIQHSCLRNNTSSALQQAQANIVDLFNKIKHIQAKAKQSEIMVQEICRDITSLDAAKKHLTDTIRALRNLHMLVSAVNGLEGAVMQKNYKEIARLIKASSDLFTLFLQYGNVPKIKELQESVDLTKSTLKQQLTQEFHRILPSPLIVHEPALSNMASACLVVDVLESSFKSELLNWFCNYQLDEYSALFSLGKDGATIDQIDRRYAWLRRWYTNYDQRYYRVFPTHWHVPIFITKEFCKMTKIHIGKMLNNAGRFDVTVMINSLLKTLEFERELNIRFRRSSQAITIHDVDPDDEHANDALVDQIKRKYKRKDDVAEQQQQQQPSDDASDSAPNVDFTNMISDAFAPFMSGYIEMERKQMIELIEKFDKEEHWSNPEEGKVSDRFGSSNDMFQYIKNSINRCSKLNKNQTLFSLYKEYKRGLSSYCALLENRLPKKQEGQSLSQNEIILSCFIINTCEYCNETLPGLGERIQSMIDESLKQHIDFNELQEEFSLLINKSVQVLIASMWSKLNKVLHGMTKLNWKDWSSVGDESSYVAQTLLIFKEELPLISAKISPRYHPFFCNQIASTFIPRYVDSIYRCKRIGEMGAQQMSLDAHALKNVLLQVPNISANNESGKSVNKSYQKYVNTEMSKAEALLKTLVSPQERVIVTFKALLPKSSIDDLMRIMSLRGLTRKEQEFLVQAYNNSTADPNDHLTLKKEHSDRISNIFSQLRNN